MGSDREHRCLALGLVVERHRPDLRRDGLHAASLSKDPAVYLLGDPYRPLVQQIDAAKYRHLTFTIEYDRKDYRWDSSLGFQRDLGGVARVIWQQANGTSGLTNTQDVIVVDGGPHTYAADLATYTKFGGNDCVDCTLETGHGTDLWAGQNLGVPG